MQLTFSDRFLTVFRLFSEHQFPLQWSENSLNVSDRFKTEPKSAINMYPFFTSEKNILYMEQGFSWIAKNILKFIKHYSAIVYLFHFNLLPHK